MKLFKFLILIAVIGASVWIMSNLLLKAIHKMERVECYKLQEYAHTYPAHLFYITQAENNMCNRIGLPVIAKVVK